jgi:hypothetical protein
VGLRAIPRPFCLQWASANGPTTVAGIERYLSSGLVKGMGPVLANKLVGRFGAEVLTAIENRLGPGYSVINSP